MSINGTVYLIGAGPGDPDLMTVKGLNILRRADAVLYDALINPVLLQEIPLSSQLINVGKRKGLHSMKQEEINQQLIDLAGTCQTVVRLKGGDPFIFGRGGEEMLALRQAGVRVEVVPGVSSINGALAYAGVPLTHRNMAANFAVVTGHRAREVDEQSYWQGLAQLDTLIIVMGLTQLHDITKHLLTARKSPDTPALAIHWGTLPEQEVVTATLATLTQRVAEVQLQAPAIIVIGEVVSLAEALRWFPGIYHEGQLGIRN